MSGGSASAPGSSANLGPGFDVLADCLGDPLSSDSDQAA